MNLWRDLPVGDDPPNLINMIVEVLSGTRDKYEYHREWEVFMLDRVLYSSVVFPIEYGFIPRTWAEDGDPLDIMMLSYEPAEVGCLIKVRPIGALIMEDEAGEDCKILSIPVCDPRFAGYTSLEDVHPHLLKEIREFFEVYKRLEPGKWARSKEWKGVEEAKKIIRDAMELYKKKFETKDSNPSD
jgi:inorganic pyrophosphatase